MTKLADLYVQFSAKGGEETKGAIAGIGQALAAVGGPAGVALAAVDALGKFALAGVASSAEGQRLNAMLDRLSRIVGGVLAPVLDAASAALSSIMGPARQVGEVVGSVIGGVVERIQTVWSVFQPLVSAVWNGIQKIGQALAPVANLWERVFRGMMDLVGKLGGALSRIFGKVLLAQIELLVAALKPFLWLLEKSLEGVEKMMQAFGLNTGKKAGGFRELSPQGGGGIEAVQGTYNRIQATALKDPLPKGYKTDSELLKDIATYSKTTATATVGSAEELKLIRGKKGAIAD